MGSLKGEEIFSLLDVAGVADEALRHPAVYTIDGLDALELPKKERIAKNLYLRDDKRRHYYLVVAEKGKRADLKALRRTISSRPLSFASKEETEKLLGVSPRDSQRRGPKDKGADRRFFSRRGNRRTSERKYGDFMAENRGFDGNDPSARHRCGNGCLIKRRTRQRKRERT